MSARRSRTYTVVLATILSICGGLHQAPAFAQGCPELVGRWPFGPPYAVAISGDYVYFGSGTVLLIADVSAPASPQLVGEVLLPDFVGAVEVSGGFAYVADYDAGLRVIDVSTPAAPIEVGFVDTPGRAFGVAVSGGFAYVADFTAGLRVVDVSTPAAPIEVGFYDTPGRAYGVAVSGGYAYVADWSKGLRVVDVSTPAAPIEVGFYDTPGSAYGVAVSGGYAYVGDGTAGLRVVDVSTPAAPIEVGYTSGLSYGVAVSGGYAYVVDNNWGLRVIDVSMPAVPVEVAFFVMPGQADDVAVSGNYAYVADGNAGLRVVDVSTPAAPFEVGFYGTPGYANGVAVSGGYAYVAEGEAGIEIFLDCSIFSDGFESGDTSAWSNGAIGWWHGDGNADDALGNNHGALNGGMGFTAGVSGQAFLLDGLDDYVSVPHHSTFDFGTGDISIVFWARTTQALGWWAIIDKRSALPPFPQPITGSTTTNISSRCYTTSVDSTQQCGPRFRSESL